MSTPQGLEKLDYDNNVELQRKQRANLAAVLQQEKFADLTFVVGPTKSVVRANRVFLASISKTFEQLLYPEDASQNPSEVHFPDISASAFRAVLAFAYCNDPQITADNVLSLKYICERFGIDTLSEICSNFWIQTLTPENILSLLNQAIVINSMGFIQECQERINSFAMDAEIMLQSTGFAQMNLKTMIVFLQTDNLKVSEDMLWDYCLKWADYQTVNEEPGAILNQSQSFQRELSYHQQSNSMNAQFSVEVEELVEETKENLVDQADEEEADLEEEEEDEAKKEEEADGSETNNGKENAKVPDEENYDEDGNRVAGVNYIDEMAPEDADKEEEDDGAENAEEEEDEPELMNIVITPAAEEQTVTEQVYADDAKNAPWRMNVMQPKGRIDLLKCIKPYIRWGAMDGAYFVKKVIPEGIFEPAELITILKYYQCAEEGCGEFVTDPRWQTDDLVDEDQEEVVAVAAAAAAQSEPEPVLPEEPEEPVVKKMSMKTAAKKMSIKTKIVAIQRGEIIVHKWTYPGGKRMDAICMECSADTRLAGIGIFDCQGKCTVRARVYRGDNGDGNEKNIVGESTKQTFANDEASNLPQQLRFKEAVNIEKGQRYTIELWQQNMESDAVSYQIKKGRQTVMCQDKENGQMFEVNFSNAARSKNGTNEKKGAIPTLYFEVNA